MKEALKDRILSAVPIDQYIGRTVVLKKQGRYLKGLCPFHGEKTPSFTVTPEKGIFHCFGCGRSGDLFGFVMEHESVSFPQAVEILANYAGIAIEDRRPSFEEGPESVWLDLLSKARFVYHDYLVNQKGGRAVLDYLTDRGINIQTIEAFKLGASPNEWQFLLDRHPGEEMQQSLIDAGLAKKNDQGRVFDFFRNRVMFPIEDISDRCVGFGGRVLDAKDQPKYINSPDSSLFHKGRLLYGLNRALSSLRQNRRAILVEGYLDVIGLYQSGIHGAVAPLGTAFTDDHRSLIGRYADEVLIFFDGDRAGRSAALKAAQILMNGSSQARLLFLPSGVDPFDFSRSADAASTFEQMAELAIPAYRFLLVSVLDEAGIEDAFSKSSDSIEFMASLSRFMTADEVRARLVGLGVEYRKNALSRLVHFLSQLRDLDRNLLQDEAASMLGIDVSTIRSEFQKTPVTKLTHRRMNETAPVIPKVSAGQRQTRLTQIERELMAYLFLNPVLFPVAYTSLQSLIFEDVISETLWRILENRAIIEKYWTGDVAEMSEFPADVRELFIPIVLKHRQAKTDKINQEILLELSTKHSLECVEQELKEKENEINLTDDPGSLVTVMHGLSQEKRRLKSLLRKGEQ